MVATSEGLSGADPFAGDPNGPYAKANAIANPGTSWTGWYAGLNAGGCWGPGSARFVSADPDPNNALFTLGHQAGVLPVALAPDMKGFSGGVQAGYNLQSGRVVAGVEADTSYTGLQGLLPLL